jgi:exopolyphosphatase/guanosine-5'-triphosphate,3'-diphosphate pyrophosphatase
MRVGAIDIGSNSVRMLVAELTGAAETGADLITVARSGESCRLARGLERTGSIEDEMAERAASVAGDFARRARGLGATHVVVGATAALRRASNGAAVAARIAERTGVEVRILTGDEEAQLVYRAVIAGLGAQVRSHACVVFDLGGGSTEVVSGVGERAGRWTSLPFGAVSLTDRHLKGDPPAGQEIDALRDEVRQTIMQQCAYMPERTPILAGVGGTVTVLASLDRNLSTYDPALLEGWQIAPDRLDARIDQIVQSTARERGSWPIMGEGRADIVVAGALVVRELAHRFPGPGLVCSTQGLRYALARLAAEELRERNRAQS